MPTVSKTHPKAVLREREDLTDSLAVFRFELEGGIPDFEPGQFLTLGLPHPDKPGKVLWRPYSIASPPERKDLMELYVRWARRPVPGKFTTLLWPMGPGDELVYREPKGAFTIQRTRPDGSPETRRMVLVGGGTGIAPFIAYALHLHHHGCDREILLCHGASYVEELGYRKLLQGIEEESLHGRPDWKFRYLATISRPQEERNAGWDGPTGRVETLIQPAADGGPSLAERVADERFTPENTTFYVCGFQGTVDAVMEAVRDRGFVTRKEAREDGSFDVLYESYG